MRLPFKVMCVSSEEKECPASELMVERAGACGWASERFCSWPQVLVLQFRAACRLDRLKILSHQYKIATRVEIFVGVAAGKKQPGAGAGAGAAAMSGEWLAANFRRLGHISFSSNSHTGFKARELKSVHLEEREG
jgi:centrosomal protein CEP104